MISITCTHCKTRLEMDEAFAGGVCRCQHCGTIQTVPAQLKRPASPQVTTSVDSVSGSRAVFGQGGAEPVTNSELEGMAEVVASSGLRSKRLVAATESPDESVEPQAAQKKSMMLPLIVIGVAIFLIILVVGGFFLLRGHTATGGGDDAGPSFVGLKLDVPSVVYVIDRGNATTNNFDAIKAATYRSIQLIGPSKKFAVLLTDNDTEEFTYPKQGMEAATSGDLENLKGVLQDVVATGNSNFEKSLKKAADLHPGAIVITTAKYPLDDPDIAALKELQSKGIPVNTFAIGDIVNPPLQEVSSATRGQYRQVSDHDLRAFAGEQ